MWRSGTQALGENFHGALPWGYLDNRPFLHCLHGLGICRWRRANFAEARGIFRRLLRLNPDDNQGIRFLWDDVVAGAELEEVEGG